MQVWILQVSSEYGDDTEIISVFSYQPSEQETFALRKNHSRRAESWDVEGPFEVKECVAS
jgi:hypothetical protein